MHKSKSAVQIANLGDDFQEILSTNVYSLLVKYDPFQEHFHQIYTFLQNIEGFSTSLCSNKWYYFTLYTHRRRHVLK